MGYPATQTTVVTTTHFPDSVPTLLAAVLGMVRREGASGLIGRLVERSGPFPAMHMELLVPLSQEEGDELLGMFLPDRAESPSWE